MGNFEVGKEFDALLIKVDSPGSQIDVFKEDTPEDLIQKFIFLGELKYVSKHLSPLMVVKKRKISL